MVTSPKTQHVLVDPTTTPLVPPFTPAPRLPDLREKRLALIDDSKENAKELLEEMTALLRERFGIAEVEYHRKPSASKQADREVIAQLARTCDYAIVAIGS